MIKSRRYLILLIIWMLFIFYLSHQPADISSDQSMWVMNLIEKLNINLDHGFTRSFAHVFIYIILGILAQLSLNLSIAKIVIFGIIYMFSDEIHQIFVNGRTFQIVDLIKDFAGYTIGLFAYRLGLNKIF